MGIFSKHGRKIRALAITLGLIALTNYFISKYKDIKIYYGEAKRDPIVKIVYSEFYLVRNAIEEAQAVLDPNANPNIKKINEALFNLNKIRKTIPDSLLNKKYINYLISKNWLAVDDTTKLNLILNQIDNLKKELMIKKIEILKRR